MTSFETFADLMGTRSSALSTGLPQLDRVAPMTPGSLTVLIGPSGVGKSRIAAHIADTVGSTHERGAFVVEGPTTLDMLEASLSYRVPAMLVVDPLAALTAAPEAPADLTAEAVAEQRPIHPAELGRLGLRLRDMAQRHRIPIVLCHRYTPIRDSVTGLIVSTESANPLLDVADLVAVVRVQADPSHLGLEILRNRLGPITNLRVPLPALRDNTVCASTAPEASCATVDDASSQLPDAQAN